MHQATETTAILERILQRYADSVSPHLEAEPQVHRGFTGATVYRIQTASGEYAMRNWGAAPLTPRRISGLHRLLQFIRSRGVSQVAVPLVTSNGETLVSDGSTDWQLEPWMPGRADFWKKPNEQRLSAAVDTLADWHRAAREFAPAETEREWFRCERRTTSPTVRQRLQKIRKWQRGRLARLRRILQSPDRVVQPEMDRLAEFVAGRFDEVSDRIAAELQAALDFPVDLQPCLRDVWHDHVLFSGDRVTGLIDANASRTENVATDLARLLGSFVEDDATVWQTAVNRYADCNALTETEVRLMRILDRSLVLLSGLTWIDRYYFRKRAFPDWNAVVDRLEQLSRRLTALR